MALVADSTLLSSRGLLLRTTTYPKQVPTNPLMPERQPYQGPARKLVLAFDVGTTYSGVSYSILDPGEPPVVCGVTR